MFFINIFIIIVFVMLAIISRKHFSKYKKRGINRLVWVWLGMGEVIYDFVSVRFSLDRYRLQLRKINVLSPTGINHLLKGYLVKGIGAGAFILCILNIIGGILWVSDKLSKDKEIRKDYVIAREGFDGDIRTEEIYIRLADRVEKYEFQVSPVQLTREEFYLEAEEVFVELDNKLTKMGVVSKDIELPQKDNRNVFSISWRSDNPELLSSSGKVREDIPEEPVEVGLTATIEYLDYKIERKYCVYIGKELNQAQQTLEEVKDFIDGINKSNPNQEYIVLPKEVLGVKLSMEEKEYNSLRSVGIGLLLIFIIALLSVGNLKDKVKLRDRELIRSYPAFVNKLWLYLGTGMTVKSSFMKLIDDWNIRENILIKELQYALNQIDTGGDEGHSYEECGERLGISMYKRLMRQISQNIRMGTKDLRRLMESQVNMALEERRELAKKAGEEASTKLIFPMVILLVVIMMIIMVPALMGL